MRSFWHYIAGILIACLVFIAILINVLRVVTPQLVRYQADLETWVTQQIHQPVKIQRLEAYWQGLGPNILLQNVSIYNASQKRVLVKIPGLVLHINLLDSILSRTLVVESIDAVGLHMSLWQMPNGDIQLSPTSSTTSNIDTNTANIINTLLSLKHANLHNLSIIFHDKNKRVWDFSHISTVLHNTFNHHILSFKTNIGRFGKSGVEGILNLEGKAGKLKTFSGTGFLNVRNSKLGAWLKDYDYGGFKIAKGIGNFKLWTTLKNGKLSLAQATIGLRNTRFVAQKSGNVDDVPYFNANLAWQRKKDGWVASGDEIKFRGENKFEPDMEFRLFYGMQNDAPVQQFHVNHIDFNDLKYFISNNQLLSSKINAETRKLHPSGILDNVTVTHEGDLKSFSMDDMASKINVLATFSHLSMHSVGKIPGFSDANGFIHWTPTSSKMSISGDKFVFYDPNLFRYPSPPSKMRLALQVEHSTSDWRILVNHFEVANDFVNLKAISAVDFAKGAPPNLNLLVSGKLLNLPQGVKYFLPVHIMKPHLVEWLDDGIVSGKSGNVTVAFRGPISHFPFDAKDGQFVIDAPLHDVNLMYEKGWPMIKNMDPELVFFDRSMHISVNNGTLQGMKLNHVVATIPTMGKGFLTDLNVDIDASGDLQNGWDFLSHTPLVKLKNAPKMAFSGPITTKVHLFIPIEDDNAKTKVDGNVKIPNSTFSMPDLHVGISKLAGEVSFSDKHFFSSGLRGIAFDNPIEIALNSQGPTDDEFSHLNITANGSADIKNLSDHFNFPILTLASGKSDYHLSLDIFSHEKVATTLHIFSDLKGVTYKVPPPFNKVSHQIKPLDVNVNFGSDNLDQVFVNYADIFQTAIQFKRTPSSLLFDRGEVTLGGGKAKIPNEPGLYVNGELPEFTWSQWKPLVNLDPLGSDKGVIHKQAMPSILRNVLLKINKVNALGQHFTQVALHVNNKLGFWLIEVASNQVDGKFFFPTDFNISNPITGRFSKLYLEKTKGKKGKPFSPKDIPPLNLHINDFRFANKPFGEAQIALTPTDNGVKITQLTLDSKVFKLATAGEWTVNNGVMQTRLKGNAESGDIGKAFKTWGLPTNIVGSTAMTKYDLYWHGLPYDPDLQSMKGNLYLDLGAGRIVNLSKDTEDQIGIGRVLNLLSLQTLVRRLSFDFSDLTKDGYPYDAVKGNFIVNNGTVTTNDFMMNGPIALVSLKGKMGLVKKTYDMKMNVAPYLTSSFPIIAALAGGPIVGLAVFLANAVLSPELQSITSYNYTITGPWNKPDIVKAGETKSSSQSGDSK